MSDEPGVRRDRAERLSVALQEYMRGQGFRDGMLGDWLVVATNVFVDDEGDPDAEYFVAVSGGAMLQHQALGLLAKARSVLEGCQADE